MNSTGGRVVGMEDFMPTDQFKREIKPKDLIMWQPRKAYGQAKRK